MDINFLRHHLVSYFLTPAMGMLFVLLTLMGCNPKTDEANTIVITGLSATSGPPAGGATVTITGTGFTFIEGVSFDSLKCKNLLVASSTTLTCTIPAHAVGTVVVLVSGKGGRKGTAQYSYVQDSPLIRSFSPTGGALAGNTTLTIYGEGFITGSSVTVDGTTCTNPAITSFYEMNCKTPAKADGSYSVIVTNPNGLTSTASSTYRYRTAPTITSISPLSGTNVGGDLVTITGTDFSSSASATIGSSPCFSPSVTNSTTMTCRSPALGVGLYDVKVINSDSQSSGNYSSFESLVVPSVVSVTPSAGALAGGAVTIRGTNFLSGADVIIDGSTISATFVSTTVLTVTLPAKVVGTYDLKVINPNTNTATEASDILALAYTYQNAPDATSVSPATGSLAGGETITISGTGFLVGATVLVGGSTCRSVNVVSSTSLTCRAPAHAAGTVDVKVTNADAQLDTLTNGYTYRGAPTITSISPDGGPAVGGGTLVITGTSFFSDATVKVGGIDCTPVVVTPQTSISCTVPAGTGTVNVVVTHLDGQTATLTSGYAYRGPPVITTVSPDGGHPSGATTVSIVGSGFSTGVTVSIDSVPCVVSASTSTSITCQTGAHAAGNFNVVVTNNDGQATTETSAYTYRLPPTVTTVTPAVGGEAGGTAITIDGSDFITGATVTVGGSPCTNVVTASTQITCDTPAHAAGVVSIIVTNPDTQLGTKTSAFTYQLAPTVTSVSPTVGDVARPVDLAITITGTGFLTGAKAYLGTNGSDECDTTVVNSLTSVTCNILAIGGAARTVGVKTVRVMNTDLQVGSKASGFTFLSPPTISNVSPSGGLPNAQTNVTLTGTNFYTGAVVTFGGSSCTNVVVSSDGTSITCTTPALAAGPAVNVIVTNVDSQTGTSNGAYTYQAAPVISYSTPSMGPMLTPTNLTITGTGFLTGARVFVGANECTSVVVAGDGASLTCTTPGSPTSGPATITVTNTDQQTTMQTTGFIYLLPVTVTGVTSQFGPLGGLNTVTIAGTQFYPGATVLIGANPCTNVNVLSTTSITCEIPASLFVTSTAVDVSVTSSNQTGTLTSGYTYHPAPTVSGISPSAGALAGGTLLTVSGADFVSGIKVYVNGTACTNVIFVSSTSVTCLTPSKTVGTYDVSVENLDTQTRSIAGVYTYQAAPTVTSVSPNVGPLAGLTPITITGTGFISSATVSFSGGGSCANVVVVNSTSITCTTPSKAAGVYTLSVVNSDNQSGSLANAYTYQTAPSVSSITPSGGAIGGATTVTIAGTGFVSGATVQLGGVTCTSPAVTSSSSMTCITGNNVSAGVVDTVVSNTDTQTGTLASSYTYRAAPTVTSLSVAAGALAGGTSLTITGTGFLAGATVAIGGTTCTSVVVNSATSISCTTLAKSAGTYDVVVTNSDAQTGTLSSSYTYRAAPAISSVSPALGALAGSTSITITGSGFITSATVSLGGSSCAVTALTATSITCTTTAHAAGQVNVVVTNPELQTGTLTNGFTYLGAPTVTSVLASSGPQAGSTSVTITGTNFYAGATVLFDASSCTSVSVVSATSITCSTPSHAAGAVRVSVFNADTQSGYLDGAYTYTAVAVLSFSVGASSPTPPNPDNYGSTTTNITHTFTVRNTGEGDSSVISVSRTGLNPAAWFVGTDTCAGATLTPNSTCTIQLTFFGSVLSTGSYSAILNATASTGGTATNSVTGSVP